MFALVFILGASGATGCTMYHHVWRPFSEASSTTVPEIAFRGLLGLVREKLDQFWTSGWKVAVNTADPPWVGSLAAFLAQRDAEAGFDWAGVVPLFSSATALLPPPGCLWVDILDPQETWVAMVDTNVGPAFMVRVAWLNRCIARLIGRTQDGHIPLIEEIPWSAQLEWDIMTPSHFLVGGIWLRRVAWKRFPMNKRHEWHAGFPPANQEELNAKPFDVEYFFLDPAYQEAKPPPSSLPGKSLTTQ